MTERTSGREHALQSAISKLYNETMEKTKRWYESRTIWLAILQGVSGIIIALNTQYPELGGLLVAKAIVDVVIRITTTEQIG